MATSAAKIYWDALYKNLSLKWNLTLKSLLKLSLVLPVLEIMDAGERERHQKVWFTSLGKLCVAEFRFQKHDIYNLPSVLQVLDEIVCYVCYDGTKVSNNEALCIFLKKICLSMKIFRFNTWIGKTYTRSLYYKQFCFKTFFMKYGGIYLQQ